MKTNKETLGGEDRRKIFSGPFSKKYFLARQGTCFTFTEEHLIDMSMGQNIKNRIGELNKTEIVKRSEEMASLMAEIKEKDRSVNLELRSQTSSPLQLAQHEKRLALMQAINECNEQLTAQIQDIIAVQKTKISKICSGREGMNGYASQIKKTGVRINSNA